MKPHLVFLYTELADYTVNCLNLLAEQTEVTVVFWPVNQEAPFKLKLNPEIRTFSRHTLSVREIQKIIYDVKPKAVFVSGWMDKGYLKAINQPNLAKKRVLMMDTAWNVSLKQAIGSLFLRKIIKGVFSHAFVSGNDQKLYAQKLGIRNERISTGFYTANVDLFGKFYSENKERQLQHQILYLGRYVKHKGIFELWKAFIEIIEENPELSHWKLNCVGTGDQWENRIDHPNIVHFGFKQPQELMPILSKADIYVLPSHFEPWGVSVHEMAAAGFPILLSHAVGSKEVFLEEGKNGYLFKPKSVKSLKKKLLKMMQMPQEELRKFGEHSHQLAQKITPQKWVNTVMQILQD